MLQRFFLIVTIATLVLTPRPAHAAPGDLDPTFGSGGTVVGFPAPADDMNGVDMVMQPDGRILVVGGSLEFGYATISVARFENDGSLDASFGMDGVTKTPLTDGDDYAAAIHLLPDGRFLVVGDLEAHVDDPESGDMFVLRYLSDGTLDPSFGDDGMVRVSFGPDRDSGKAVAVQSNGRIVVAGICCSAGSGYRFALARLHADGSPDASFGDGGQVATQLQARDGINAVEVQPDGKLVVAGSSGAVPNQASWGVAFARYLPDGSIDTGFGTGGAFISKFGGTLAGINGMVLQEDGKILGAGYRHPTVSTSEILMVRLDENGALDAVFGSVGVVGITAAGAYNGVDALVQPDGGIVVAGMRYVGTTVEGCDSLLLRTDDTGALDAGFGTGGTVAVNMGAFDYARAVLRQQDGKLVVVGSADIVNADYGTLARYEGTPPGCGNGFVEPPENCDDANLAAGDGCDAACAVEPGFACAGTPSVCAAGCGDGMVTGPEACDDGDLAAGDGCDSGCRVESGWTCASSPSLCEPICADGRILGSEVCDDGNLTNGDCCDSTCQPEAVGMQCDSDDDFCTHDACNAAGVCAHVETASPTCLLPMQPGKASLKILARGPDKDLLRFRWTNGPAVAKTAFGTPADGTPQYGLCVYDESAGVSSVVMRALAQGDGDCSDQECWTETTPGWRLKSTLGGDDGIVMLKLQEGVDGKSKIQVSMKKSFLELPPLALANDPRVIVQVRSSDDQCYGAEFSTPTVNDGTEYRAKSD